MEDVERGGMHGIDSNTMHGIDSNTVHGIDKNAMRTIDHIAPLHPNADAGRIDMNNVDTTAMQDRTHRVDKQPTSENDLTTDTSIDHTPSQEIHSPLTGIAPPSDVEQSPVL